MDHGATTLAGPPSANRLRGAAAGCPVAAERAPRRGAAGTRVPRDPCRRAARVTPEEGARRRCAAGAAPREPPAAGALPAAAGPVADTGHDRLGPVDDLRRLDHVARHAEVVGIQA